MHGKLAGVAPLASAFGGGGCVACVVPLEVVLYVRAPAALEDTLWHRHVLPFIQPRELMQLEDMQGTQTERLSVHVLEGGGAVRTRQPPSQLRAMAERIAQEGPQPREAVLEEIPRFRGSASD
eukprot:264648-Amphidinium_carterae.2